jgi:hypothetical protein
MIKNLDPEVIQELYRSKFERDIRNKGQSAEMSEGEEYKFIWIIIPPNNWYNVLKNDSVLLLFILYSILLPYICCLDINISNDDIDLLMTFDYIFVIDRVMDLLVGYINEMNKLEPSITKVIFKNLSLAFFIELFITFIPVFFVGSEMNSLIFFIVKSPRFLRLFEMEQQITEIMDYNN